MMTADHHKCCIAGIALDLQWWISCLHDKHYCRRFLDSRPVIALHCHATQNACGAFCLNDWFYTVWSADQPEISTHYIDIKELGIVVSAI